MNVLEFINSHPWAAKLGSGSIVNEILCVDIFLEMLVKLKNLNISAAVYAGTGAPFLFIKVNPNNSGAAPNLVV